MAQVQRQKPKTRQQLQLQLEKLRSDLKKAEPKGLLYLLGRRDDLDYIVDTIKTKSIPYQNTETSKSIYKEQTGDKKMKYFTIINQYLTKKKQMEKKRLQTEYGFTPAEADIFFKIGRLYLLLAFRDQKDINTNCDLYKTKYDKNQITKKEYETINSICQKLKNRI